MKNNREINFVKMQATGNDFVLLDNREYALSDQELAGLAPEMCDRKYGVGSDGLIALSENSDGDLVMQYKNPDGSDAGMCGNGARCFTLFANSLGYGNPVRFRVHDKAYKAELNESGVRVHFPLQTTAEEISVDDQPVLKVYTNTEHVVCMVDPDILEKEELLVQEGRRLRNHPMFAPAGTNANFISGSGSSSLNLQTYERGVENLTLACGTGAIASALAWHYLQSAGAGSFTYTVQTRGGDLTISFTRSEDPPGYINVSLQGPVARVFKGLYFREQNE